jgi:hypothetical protein
VHGDWILQIDQLKFRIEEADLMGSSFRRPFDRLPLEQSLDDANVFTQSRERNRTKSHRAPRGKSGPDAKMNPAWGERIQRCQRAGCNRSNTIGRNQYPGA